MITPYFLASYNQMPIQSLTFYWKHFAGRRPNLLIYNDIFLKVAVLGSDSIAPEFYHFFAANLFNRLEVGTEFNSPVTNV